MRVLDYCQASAVEAVNKANDATLPHEARIEWARIAKVWQDVATHVDALENLGVVDQFAKGPTPQDTFH